MFSMQFEIHKAQQKSTYRMSKTTKHGFYKMFGILEWLMT